MLFISCGKKKENLPVNTKKEMVAVIKSEAQIAEYIRNIYQDKNGHLWFGTNDFGIVHYNGDSLMYYSNEQGFGGRQITGITEDPEENLWFATDLGVVKVELSTPEKTKNKFTNYTGEVFNNERFWSIFADSKGIIWAGSGDGLYRFDGTNWESFELPYSDKDKKLGLLTNITTRSISEDKNGNIWFGTHGNGAIKYTGNSYTQFTEKDGLADNSVDPLVEDKNGNIWLGTRFGGLSKYNDKTFTNFTENDSIGNNEVCEIYEDSNGNIWFSSEGFGVYKYNGDTFSNYNKDQGLAVKAPQAIFEDSEGRLWVGGGGGLYRYDGKTFLNITKNGPWN
jgi:ligand-binding sensor domain-containing protein